MFDDAVAAANWLMSRKNKTDLAHFKIILDALQIPYQKVPCVHIAGTNGKGSTLNYLRYICMQAGLKVATFTSPYIICHQDRFCINGEMISDHDFLDLVNRYYEKIEHYHLSMFEADVLLAFVYFYEQQVDLAFIETGIGGRLDKTNVIIPMASVITNIGYDHLKQLGPTLADVAYQKAGIIKPNVPVFVSAMPDTELAVIASEAANQHAPLHVVQAPCAKTTSPLTFDYAGMQDLVLGMEATYQIQNACLAIEVVRTLFPSISPAAIRQGLRQAVWPGRFEHFQVAGQDLYIDGAHNRSAFHALFEAVEAIRGQRAVSVIYAALRDKEYRLMAEMIRAQGYELNVCQFEDDRALSLEQSQEVAATHFYHSIDEALDHLADLSECVLVCGSLHFISQFRAKMLERIAF